MHYEGNGVPKDEALGASFFLRGCQAGSGNGCRNVSIAYANGKGVPKDLDQAFVFAQRACTAGSRAGCVRVEVARIAGDGVAKDVKARLAQLDAMCTRREVEGCEALVRLYTTGGVPADPLRLRDYSKKACDLGSKLGCQSAATNVQIDNTGSDLDRGNAGFKAQCDAGEAVGCAMLGEDYLRGIGVPVDRAKGIALIQRACRGGYAAACGRFGDGGAP